MRNQIISWLIIVAMVVLGIFIYIYGNKPQIPVVGEDGKISGNYAIAGIMRLGKPYVCTFERADDTSKIAGVIHTDGQKIYGEFRIKTDLVKDNFSSFLVVKDEKAYVWTSLQNAGYESPVAKSANKNASPVEQAQIVGLRDKILYKCEPWQDTDNSVFELPAWITFSELKT